jgi:hypothetical protein
MKGQKEKGTNKKIRREKPARYCGKSMSSTLNFLFRYKKATRNFQTCEMAERNVVPHQLQDRTTA